MFDGVPILKDFGVGDNATRLFFRENNYYDEYVLDNGIVLRKYPQIDAIVGVPTVADFGTGKYRRRVIFNESDPCEYYYIDAVGTVQKCASKVSTKSGIPTVADFASSDFIFDTNNPCDLYYNDGGTVRKCQPTVNDGSRRIKLIATNSERTTARMTSWLSPYSTALLTGGQWIGTNSYANIKLQSIGDNSTIDYIEIISHTGAGLNKTTTNDTSVRGTVVDNGVYTRRVNAKAGYKLFELKVHFYANATRPSFTI